MVNGQTEPERTHDWSELFEIGDPNARAEALQNHVLPVLEHWLEVSCSALEREFGVDIRDESTPKKRPKQLDSVFL